MPVAIDAVLEWFALEIGFCPCLVLSQQQYERMLQLRWLETERTASPLVGDLPLSVDQTQFDPPYRLKGYSLIQWKPRLISKKSGLSVRRSLARIFWPSIVPSSAITPVSGCW